MIDRHCDLQKVLSHAWVVSEKKCNVTWGNQELLRVCQKVLIDDFDALDVLADESVI